MHRNNTVLALTDNDLAYLDNLTSNAAGSNAESEDEYMPAPAYDDPWYLSRLRRFPSFYYDPYYPDYYPYAAPYYGTYGYPWRYYDDDDHHDLRHRRHGRSGGDLADTLENMRDRRLDRRENFQNFMHERRENRQERFENIRDTIQDIFSRERSFQRRGSQRNDFGRGFPQRENRGMGSGGHTPGNWFRGGRR